MKKRLSIISTLVEALKLGGQKTVLVVLLSVLTACPLIALTAVTLGLKPPEVPDARTATSAQFAKMSAEMPAYLAKSLAATGGLLVTQIVTQAGVAAILLGVLKPGTEMQTLSATILRSLRRYVWPLIILIILLSIIAVVITVPFSFLIAAYGFTFGFENGKAHPEVHSYFIGFMLALMAIVYLVFVKYALAYPLVVIEEMNPLRALARSWKMTQGFFGYVFGSYVFVGSAEYFIGHLIENYASFDQMTVARVIDTLVMSFIQCYWVFLAWCMYWRIRDAENAAMPVSESPPAWPSGPRSA